MTGRGRHHFAAAAVAACCYTLLAGYGASYRFPEVFPFFNWALFSFPPKVYDEWSIRVLSVNDQALKQPTWIEDVPQFAGDYYTGERKQVRTWGSRIEAGDTEGAQVQRVLFEQIFTAVDSVEYQLVVRYSNPVERWRTGALKGVRVVESYRWERDQDA